MKNICFVCYNLSVAGGSEKVTVDVSKALCDYYNVHIISLSGGEPFFRPDERIKYTNFNLDSSRLRNMIIPAAKKLKKYYKENNIDLSFIVETYAGFVCAFSSLITPTKQVFHDHSSIAGQWNRKDMRIIRRIASTLCPYTMVLTKSSMNDYIEKFHINPERIEYIHNWINELPSSYSYDINNRQIMSAGRFAQEKQFHTLLPEVAALVKEKMPELHWNIFGDGQYLDAVKEKIHELGLEDFITLKGMVKDLDKQYLSHGVFVLTSDREGLPLVLLEAKANGLPSVAFDVKTGPKEIIQDGVDGYLVNFGDTKTMADKICSIMKNSELRQKMSIACTKDIPRFSKEIILKQWIDYIERH